MEIGALATASCLSLEECVNDFRPIDIFDGEVLLLQQQPELQARDMKPI